MSKHTPGPWSVNPTPHAFDKQFLAVASGHGGIADVPVFSQHDCASHQVEANARLIAAAPLLLAELAHAAERVKRAALLMGSDEEFAEGAVERYRAAISAATGEAL